MKNMKKTVFICLLLFSVLGTLLNGTAQLHQVQAAEKVSLNKKNITLYVGKTYQLKVKGTKKKVRWSVNKKRIASVSQKGKVKAKEKGQAIITAKVGKKKYTCKVTVKNKSTAQIKAEQILSLVNKERKKRGRKPLVMNTALNKAANKRAKEIKKSFSHMRPDGMSCFTVLDDCDIEYGMAGENIAAGQTSAKSVVSAWMNSPGHRSNILNEDFKKMGVGYYKLSGSDYTYYWVQIFTD